MKPKLMTLAVSVLSLISLPLLAVEHPNTEGWKDLFLSILPPGWTFWRMPL